MTDHTDLTEQIRRWDEGQLPIHMETLMEAARRYANLDYKAGWHWAVRRQAMSLEFATGIINAALGITEDDG